MFKNDTVRYSGILPQIQSSISDQTNLVTIQATVVAILHEELNIIKNNQVTRTVIYVVQSNGDLLLGPFQGKKAIQRIKKGSNICSKAIEKKECLIADNKDREDIPKSEIAAPIFLKGKATAVLYLDSNSISAFTDKDREVLNQVAKHLTTRWPSPRGLTNTSSSSLTRFLWLILPTSIILTYLFRTTLRPLLNNY